MFTSEQIQELSLIPETSFRFQATVNSLVSFYKWVRQEWSKDAIALHRQKYSLDCRSTMGKVRFAWYAAKELSQNCLPLPKSEPQEPETTDTTDATDATQTESDKNVKTVRVLSQAIALLNPVPPTNGLENAPAWQILGKPIYWDELIRNYKVLRMKFHPDVSTDPNAEEKVKIASSIFHQFTCADEDGKILWFKKYSPLIPFSQLGKENLQLAMNQLFPFKPEDFWDF